MATYEEFMAGGFKLARELRDRPNDGTPEEADYLAIVLREIERQQEKKVGIVGAEVCSASEQDDEDIQMSPEGAQAYVS